MMLSTSGSSAVAARMVVFPSTQLFRAFWACQSVKQSESQSNTESRDLSYLLGFLPVAVLDESDPMSEIEVEVVKGPVLHAESPQS